MVIIKDEMDYIINSDEYKKMLKIVKNQELVINHLLQKAEIYKAEIDLLNTQIEASVKFVKILKDEL